AVALLLAALIAGGGRAEAVADGKPIWFYRAESPAGRATFFYPSFHLRDDRVPRPLIALLGSVDRLKLSFVATILALPCPKPGAEGGSYEEEVELAAQQRGLEITGLESAEEEFA